MHTHRPLVPPLAVILLGILAVSTASVLIRFAQAHAPSIVIAAYRLTVASLVLTPLVWLRHRSEWRALDRREIFLGIASGVFLAVHFATWISSLEFTSVTSSIVIVTTTPLWVAILSPILLREPIRPGVALGLILSLAGGVIVALADCCGGRGWASDGVFGWATGTALGNGLALAGALSAAGYLVIGRSLRSKLPLLLYIFIVYSVAAGALLLAAIGSGASLTGYPAEAYLWFVLLALVPQLLGHSSFNWALGYLPVSFVSITLLGEPVGTIVLAYFFLRERPVPLELVGAILILMGIYIASQNPRNTVKE